MEELSLKKKVDTIFEKLNPEYPKKKSKKIKIPRKARVRKGKAKRGWIGILRVDENNVITGERQKIEDSAFTLKGGTVHATNGQEVLFWNGKYPVIVQETKSRNPKKFNDGDNQTYGQKYILAKMLKDAIKVKTNSGSIIIWILIIGGLVFGAQYLFGGGF